MNYPVWQLAMGGGSLIAMVSIFHVFVSHFAVGGGLFLVLTEMRAYRRSDEALLGWLKRHSKFFALLTLVAGAVTGVGIWFTIGLVHPTATSALIHTFVWAWAVEWVFFVVEIAAALLYVASWERASRASHLAIGWVYFVSAFMSLVVINGILTFMFSPGDWLQTRSVIDGFFNPTYLPSLVVRTLGAMAFAGLFVLATAWREPLATRARLTRYAALWALPATAVGPLAALYYFSVAGEPAWESVQGVIPAAQMGLRLVMAAAVLYTLVLAALAVVAGRRPQLVSWPAAAVLLLLGLASIGGAEYVRENVRKPFVIGNAGTGGYLYVNALTPDQLQQTRRDGLLAHAKWVPPRVRDEAADPAARGQALFVLACSGCHTLNAHHAIRPLVQGRSVAALEQAVLTLEERRGRMPPFPGNAGEARALARWLGQLDGALEEALPEPAAPASVAGPPVDSAAGAPVRLAAAKAPALDGAALADKYCLSCHTLDEEDGLPGLRQHVKGWTAVRAYEALGDLKKLNKMMPPFRGTDAERRALADYLSRLGGAASETPSSLPAEEKKP